MLFVTDNDSVVTAYYSYLMCIKSCTSKQRSSSFTFQRACNDLVELFTKTDMSTYHHSVQDLVSQVTFKKVEGMLQVFDTCLLMCIVEHLDAQLLFKYLKGKILYTDM